MPKKPDARTMMDKLGMTYLETVVAHGGTKEDVIVGRGLCAHCKQEVDLTTIKHDEEVVEEEVDRYAVFGHEPCLGNWMPPEKIVHLNAWAWMVYERVDGKRKNLGLIQAPDAADRARRQVDELREKGTNAFAEEWHGSLRELA